MPAGWQSFPVSCWGRQMPIYRLFRDAALEPELLTTLADVFEDVSRQLGLAERTDPLRDTVAMVVIRIAQQGERDPIQLRIRTLAEFR